MLSALRHKSATLPQYILLAVFAFVTALLTSALHPTAIAHAAGFDDVGGDTCSFSYSSDKKTISGECKPKAGTFGGLVFSTDWKLTGLKSGKQIFTGSASGEATAGSATCTSTIEVSGSSATSGKISGDLLQLSAPPRGVSSYSCASGSYANLSINANSSNSATISNAALAAIKKATASAAKKYCDSQPKYRKETPCLDAWNTILEACHRASWATLQTLIMAEDVIGDSKYGAINDLTKAGRDKYRSLMITCITKNGGKYFSDASVVKGILTDKAVSDMAGAVKDTAIDVNQDTTTEETTSCAVDGIGWIVCPVASAIAKFNDALFGILENLLGINPSMFDTSGSTDATYNTWRAVRNIANVAFVIAFLIIIYSQLTGVGVTNYGIKHLLPKLVIAAVLVNISFWLCAIAVDISNILGSSIYDLFMNYAGKVDDTQNGLGAWDNFTAWLLAGGSGTVAIGASAIALGTYGFWGALALLIPLAVTALVAVLTVVFVLTARQAFIIILVVISPLAFVAYLLPNTENWFDKWRKFFFSLLLIYPVVGALFGGAQLAAGVIRAGADDALTYLLSLVVQVIPLFLVPILLKFSGGLIGRVAGMINNPNKGPFDRLKKSGERFSERRKGLRMGDRIERAQAFREGTKGSNVLYGASGSWRRRARSRIAGIGNINAADAAKKDEYAKAASDSAVRNYVAERAVSSDEYAKTLAGGSEKLGTLVKAYSIQAVEEEREKDVKAAQVLLQDKGKSMGSDVFADYLRTRVSDQSASLEERLAAVRQFGKVANATRVSKMTEDMAMMGETAPGTETTAALQREFSGVFGGDGRLPSSVSATMRSQMQNGQFKSKLTDRMLADINGGIELDDTGAVINQRIDPQTGQVQKGKISKKYVASMDVDEMKDWREAIDKDPSLVNRMTAEGKASILKAMQTAADDPRLNINYGPREFENMEAIAAALGGSFKRPTK